MVLKRIVYLAYYIKQFERKRFTVYLHHASKSSGQPKLLLVADALRSVFRYNISLLDYFLFRFYSLTNQEREAWAGTGYMYEYQLRMNPLKNRNILEDKTIFYKYYRPFFVHQMVSLKDLKSSVSNADSILSNASGKLVFKSAKGNCGKQVEVRNCIDFTQQSLIEYMEESDFQLVEEYLIQHPELMRLSPSAVNTVRIFTQLDEYSNVHILGCRLRISVNSSVDNLAAGNIAAPVDELTGRLLGPAVYSDITKPFPERHPITGVEIDGFQIPLWQETLRLVKKAARHYPQNRSVGWDIVITEQGPGLIEGNHDWCKLLWQLPVRSGLKSILTNY